MGLYRVRERYLQSCDITGLLIDSEVSPENASESDQVILRSMSRQVPKLCNTRRTARVQTISSIIAKYKSVFLTLHDIARESCDNDARKNASSYVRLLQSPGLIVSLVVSQYILSFSNPLCLVLQKTSCDLLRAHTNARLCLDTLRAQCTEHKFKELFVRAEAIAGEVNSEILKPRTSKQSQFPANSGADCNDADSSECYFRRNIYYPLVDHCISEFEKPFPDPSQSIFIGCKTSS